MNRRSHPIAAALLAAVAALALGACGGDDGSAASTTEEADEGAGSSGTRTVEHAMGTTDVPTDPERVVVLDSSFLDAALALEVEPVGATQAEEGFGVPEYLADRVPDIEVVGLTDEPNLEAIAALEPDLILGAKVRHEALYDQLAGIAPTVFTESSGTNWKEGLEVTADALDATDEAEELLAAHEARADEIGEEVGAEGTEVSMVRFLLPDEIRLYGPETFSGSILTDVGFDLGDHDWDEFSMVSMGGEQLGRAEGDLIFASAYGGRDTQQFEEGFSNLEGLWKGLPAVESGNQHWVDDDTWMLGIGPIGADLVLDDIEAQLTET